MLCVYQPDCTDFSGNGIGTISPSSALVKETLNGEYELEIVHPFDRNGKWRRLAEGYIIRAPVPSGTTPQVQLAYKEFSEGKPSTGSAPPGTHWYCGHPWTANIKSLGNTRKAKKSSSWNRQMIHTGKSCVPTGSGGYMPYASLSFVRNTSGYADTAGAVIEGRQLRDQPFRIYRVVPELDQVTAYARHIFYDLLDNMVKKCEALNTTSGKTVVDQISEASFSANCEI